jgi:DNA mismatch repair protein MutL
MTMPGHLLDVNVHPTKSEVRFSDPQVLFSMIAKSIGNKLKPNVASHRPISVPSHYPSAADMKTLFTSQPTYPMEAAAPTSLHSPTQSYGGSVASSQADVPKPAQGFFGQLTYWSQLDGTYLICKNDHELILIDQHAAHERVRYQALVEQYSRKKTLAQQTLIPTEVALSPSEFEWAQEHSEVFAQLGFDLEPFGQSTFILRAIPSSLSGRQAQSMLKDLLQEGLAYGKGFAMQDFVDHALSTMACHSAVRAHDRLSAQEVQHLLDQMDQVDLTSYCPHGRPTFLRFDLPSLEKLFFRKV